ncbi:helix-turn-helix domain-containing protein [Streptomyces carpinensis]|uniref:helix-turn-helix domain-containing protein n=1 Tax=Streptomyces carpinensis TaxID=66369 RepID=UPI000A3698ED|nr:helix-turn-helix domain-containing protein [Streptomyces carpinensis]
MPVGDTLERRTPQGRARAAGTRGAVGPAGSGSVLPRREVFLALARRNSPGVDVVHHRPGRVAGIEVRRFGDVGTSTVSGPATTFRRSARQARAEHEAAVVLSLQERGTTRLELPERTVRLRAGELVLHCTSDPGVRAHGEGAVVHYVYLPLHQLHLPPAAVRSVLGTVLTTDQGVPGLVAGFFGRLLRSPGLTSRFVADTLAAPGTELVRSLIVSNAHQPDSPAGRNAVAAARILDFVRAHLDDPDLTAERVAREHHVSVRQMYAVLSRSGVSLGRWIRAQRLERCRRELSQPDFDDLPIAGIAQRWGFVSPAHFSRVFKEHYGVSPREWRTAAKHRRRPDMP